MSPSPRVAVSHARHAHCSSASSHRVSSLTTPLYPVVEISTTFAYDSFVRFPWRAGPPMPVTRLNHAVLYVRDVRRSVEFYSNVLGFRPLNDMAQLRGAAFLQAPGST